MTQGQKQEFLIALYREFQRNSTLLGNDEDISDNERLNVLFIFEECRDFLGGNTL
jgi:hypothetical protein